MAEADDIAARLRDAGHIVKKTISTRGRPNDMAAYWASVACFRAATALTDRDALIERLTRERKDFAQTISEWATKAGEAEGRLKASEWPGVVEGWKARATTAERDLAEVRAEVERLKKAVSAATDATAAYLPPDGISASECISRILGATDNPEINAIMLEKNDGRPQD